MPGLRWVRNPWQLLRELEEPGPDADRMDAENLLVAVGFEAEPPIEDFVVYYHAESGDKFTLDQRRRDIAKPLLERIVRSARRILEQGGQP